VPAKLDPELVARTEDRYAGIREGAVQELAGLLSSSDPSIALAAQEILMLMTSDDSRRVAARAQTALEAAEDAAQGPAGDVQAPAGDVQAPAGDVQAPVGDVQAPAGDVQRPPPPSPPAPPVPPRTPSSRRPLAIGGAGAAIAAVVIVAIIALSGGGSNQQGTTTAVNASDKIPAGNLVKNPSFEQSTSGWDTFQEGVPSGEAQLSREQAADAPDGHQVVRVIATGPKDFSIDDNFDTIKHSVAGQSYTAQAWAKATDETDGDKACLVVRERDAHNHERDSLSGLTLSTAAYRPVRVVHTARGSGDRIDVFLVIPRSGGSAGDSFLADAISLTPGDRGSTVGPEC
jgi:hypothetical protein